MDKMTVKGLASLEGTYDLDIISMVSVGTADSLTTREQHRLRIISDGVRPAELLDAVSRLDGGVMVALAEITLTRNGKNVNVERLWDTRFICVMGSDETPDLSALKKAVVLEIAKRADEEEADDEDDASPPAQPEMTSPNGGSSSEPNSAIQGESVPSSTGALASPKSSTSDQLTSAT